MLDMASNRGKITHTSSWRDKGWYSSDPTPGWAFDLPIFQRFTADVTIPTNFVTSSPSLEKPEESKKAVELEFPLVDYDTLNARQKENHNFHKVAAALANCGYNAMRLSDDWQGADFIAVPVDDEKMEFLRVQLKSTLTVAKKYLKKDLHIAFPDGDGVYVFPHDKIVDEMEKRGKITHTKSWREAGLYQMSPTPDWAHDLLVSYRIKILP